MAVVKGMLDRAVDEGAIPKVDTTALAHVLGGLSRELAQPDVREMIDDTPRKTAAEVVDIIIKGLTRD